MKKITQILVLIGCFLASVIPTHAQRAPYDVAACLSLSDVPLLNPNANRVVFVGGSGFFRWDATNTLATNTVIVAAAPLINPAGAAGRWVKIQSGNLPSATQTIDGTSSAVTGVIVPNAAVLRVVAAGAAYTNLATPSISATLAGSLSDGQEVEIWGTDDTNTLILRDEGTQTGSKLQLGAATRTLGKGDSLRLRYNLADGFWYESGFFNN